MKKYISILALEAKNTIYKLFAVWTVMAAAQLADFYLVLKKGTSSFALIEGIIPYSFEDGLEEAHTGLIFGTALILTAVVLIWSVSEKNKVKSKRSLWRLSVERKQITFLRAGYHILCFVALFAVQISLVVVMYEMSCSMLGITEETQLLFLAFYRNSFLHNILPLSDWYRSFRLIITILLYGMGTVYIGHVGYSEGNRGLSSITVYLSVWMTVLILTGMDLVLVDVFCILVSIGVLVIITMTFLDKMGEMYYEG